eukprot:TRINITY_DN11980_c0_g1_i1.p1 TRINITY_DN11980_c0_g1~~TRINITY_DN11980_c0_g1_i1.p1  ORF type:complete len:466 (+),score=37.15 TRINITY_DN11980_c0_g1_i1:33-1400(+)
MDEQVEPIIKNANQCLDCDATFGFIFGRPVVCPGCLRSLCGSCVNFPISLVEAVSPAKMTLCWNCVRNNCLRRIGRFTSTPVPTSGHPSLSARFMVGMMKRGLSWMGVYIKHPENEVFINRSMEARLVPPQSSGRVGHVVISERNDVPSCDDGIQNYVRIYRPASESADAKLPCLVWYHGGGFSLGSPRDKEHDNNCRRICELSKFAILSINYRKASENPFPKPVEDAFAGWRWVCSNTDALNIDSDKICVGGDSAGGNLASAVCWMAHDRNVQKPAYLVSIYGVHDMKTSKDRESWRRNEHTYTPVEAFLAMSHSYIGKANPADLESDFRVRPAMAVDLSQPSSDPAGHPSSHKRRNSVTKRQRDYVFPPALVVTAWFDGLCDDGIEFAKKLASLDPNFSLETDNGLNNRVTCVCYGQSFHGFFSSWTEGKEAVWQVCVSLRHHFGLDIPKRPE